MANHRPGWRDTAWRALLAARCGRLRAAPVLIWALISGVPSMGAAASQQTGGAAGVCRGIDIQKAIHVAASQEKVFEFWADYENFPRFMSRVREVRGLGGRRSHWIARSVPVEWISELTNVVPNALIEWRSEPGSSIRHEGIVRFEPAGHDGTRVSIRLCYVPPGGPLGHALAAVADPKGDLGEDLKRMKWLIETS